MIFKFEVQYIPGPVADAQARQDARDYLGERRWNILVEALADDRVRFNTLMMLIEIAGIRGYPMWAILRQYRMNEYCAWCREEGVPVGDDGFPLDLIQSEDVTVAMAMIEKPDHTSQ